MATLAATFDDRDRAKLRERAFYTGMAIAMVITVVAGFSRTWFLRPHFRQT